MFCEWSKRSRLFGCCDWQKKVQLWVSLKEHFCYLRLDTKEKSDLFALTVQKATNTQWCHFNEWKYDFIDTEIWHWRQQLSYSRKSIVFNPVSIRLLYNDSYLKIEQCYVQTSLNYHMFKTCIIFLKALSYFVNHRIHLFLKRVKIWLWGCVWFHAHWRNTLRRFVISQFFYDSRPCPHCWVWICPS